MRIAKLLGAVGVVGLSLAAAPAMAQDMVDEPAFDGFYVGGSFGMSVQNNDIGETILFDRGLNGSYGDTITTAAGANAFSPGFCNGGATSNFNNSCTNDKDDIEYYVRAGADAQYGKWVIGAVAEFGKTQARDRVSAFSTTPAFYTMSTGMDWNAALRARAGYVAGQSTLFYGTFGGAYAKLDRTFATGNTANSFTLRGDDMAWGWQAGGGVEQKFGKNFSVGLEYLYSRYNDNDGRVRVGTGTAPATNPFVLGGGADFARSDNNFAFHAIRLTGAFRF